MAVASIDQLVDMYRDDPERLKLVLVAREQSALDLLREEATRFGLFAEIVAEKLAATGLGEVLADEERAYIHRQYEALMARLEAEWGHGHG